MTEWDGKVGARQGRCATSGAEFRPGDAVISALLLGPQGFHRQDYAEAAWASAPREQVVSWWRHVVPDLQDRPRLKLDRPALLAMFRDLSQAADRPRRCFCYVVALCLVRAKAFRLQAVEQDAHGPLIICEERGAGVRHRVRDPRMSPEEEASMQAQLAQVVGGPAGPDQGP